MRDGSLGPDQLMRDIAQEDRFSETAFAVKEGDAYHLRWFTPGGEIDFCGHATLGTAYVLFNFYETDAAQIEFATQVGPLGVRREGSRYVMDFPAYHCNSVPVTEAMRDAVGTDVLEAYLDRDLLLVLKDKDSVVSLKPDQGKTAQLDGLLVAVTARGADWDAASAGRDASAANVNLPKKVDERFNCLIVDDSFNHYEGAGLARQIETSDCAVINEALVKEVRGGLPTEGDFAAMERLFQVVGNPTRLRILLGLAQHELCVCDLSVLLGMTKSAVSHQLANLRDEGLVKTRRDGRVVYYSTADPHVNLMLRLGLEHAHECCPEGQLAHDNAAAGKEA